MNQGPLTNENKVFSTGPKVLNGIEKLIDVWHTLDKIFIFSENINFRKIKLLGWIKLASRNLLFKTISLLWNSSTMTHFHDSVAWNINTARMKWPVVSARGEFKFSAFLVRETKMWKQKEIFKNSELWAQPVSQFYYRETKLIWSLIMFQSKVLTNNLTDDSNGIQHARITSVKLANQTSSSDMEHSPIIVIKLAY